MLAGVVGGPGWPEPLQIAIDVPPMRNANNEHKEFVVVELIDHTIITDAEAIELLVSLELDDAAGQRVDGESLESLGDALLYVALEV
jgi:hypothetical protein